MLDPGIFKAYDVRGLYGSELDEEGAYAIGRAYVEHFEPRSIAVGRDMRVSAPSMAAAVMEGAADGGADVRDLGMVGTEMVYYAVGELGLDGGICVTASHNPKQYTGMKIVRAGALPVGGDSGLEDVRVGAQAGFGPVTKRGEITPLDVWPGFVDKVLSFVDVDAIAPLRIVVDAANGMAGAMLPPVLERLPQVEVVRCYFDPDGTFPNHEPNPLLEENRAFIVAKTQEEGAALGVAYDGDADRCFFVDDTRRVRAGRLRHRAARRGDAGQEPRRNRPLRRPRQLGGATHDRRGRRHGADQPRRPRVHQAPDARGARDLRRRGLGALLLPRLHPGRHRRRPVPAHARADLEARREALRDPAAVPRELLHHGRDQHAGRGRAAASCRRSRSATPPRAAASRTSTASRSTSTSWHFNVRPSNTEPLLRLNLEALSEAEMIARRDELVTLIQS